ncbi:hypothetical protein [Paenibacillus donghaensis]|uniref:hypothetical protein n=1 Tax=Paenibacillus donghaensis TaxID=414771 RepID=UPI0012FCD28A|nr:hypothetical protein [Paenibacillus donghaensis]
MWIKIILAVVIIISFIGSVAEMDRDKEGSMHMAGICIAGILALAAIVIFS